MKTFLALSILALSFTSIAETPLIAKFNSPGYVHPDHARYESCQIFGDRIVKTVKAANQEPVTELFTHELSETELVQLIASAKAETLTEKDNYLCDAPSTAILATESDQEALGMVLFVSGGCGSPRLLKSGSSSQKLMDLASRHCPETFDFGYRD